ATRWQSGQTAQAGERPGAAAAAAPPGAGRPGAARPRPAPGARPAGARPAAQPGDSAHPERSLVKAPPPAPDYPRWRVEPGTRIRLADVDPNEAEAYQRQQENARAVKHAR